MRTEAAIVSNRIKKELKTLFPTVKFSVKSKNYSGGNHVDVSYENFLPTTVLEDYFNKYEDGKFNGMEDIYEYKESTHEIAPTGIITHTPRTKYLFFYRTITEDMKAKAEAWILSHWNCEGKSEWDFDSAIHTLLYKMDLSKGFDESYANNYQFNIWGR